MDSLTKSSSCHTIHTANDQPSLSIRLLMQGKEVGSIIGKKGDIVKRFREESCAKINITDGACPERIVTVTGTSTNIFKAFSLICEKFEEDLENIITAPSVPKPPITLRLIIPASQCGSLIGKGGCKIKELREVSGASVQVASEMLPNSTERAVTISGNSEAITQCIYNICNIMAESSPKGPTIPYKPQQFSVPPPSPNSPTLSCQSDNSMIMSSSHSSFVSPPPPNIGCPTGGSGHSPPSASAPVPMTIDSIQVLPPMFQPGPLMSPGQPFMSPCVRYTAATGFPFQQTMFSLALPDQTQGLKGGLQAPAPHPGHMQFQQVPEMGKQQGGMTLGSPAVGAGGLSHINGLNGLAGGFGPGVLSPAALAALAGGGGRGPSNHQTHEMTVPNEIIGCVIGKGGSKIAEIRQISGAMIRISNCEDRDAPANLDRTITISGNAESVALAQYLINMSIELHKANLVGLEVQYYPTYPTAASITMNTQAAGHIAHYSQGPGNVLSKLPVQM